MQHVGELFRVGASQQLSIRRTLHASRSVPIRDVGHSLRCASSVTRRSQFWAPTGGIEASSDGENDVHSLLVRAGFLRQTNSGIFHMLPLGHRVLQKIETLLDKHMTSVGASKLSLSSITTEELWSKSGRLYNHGGELFRLKDRRGARLLLGPTHEEEITALVGSVIKSHKDVPLRLYQITRKYRDEQRPRQGILRGREFIMKDLYTFDEDSSKARETYDQVSSAYLAFFKELGVPFVVANADSGSMGGDLSHEYHLISKNGEDRIVRCNHCNVAINDELFIGQHDHSSDVIEEPLSPVLKNKHNLHSDIASWWGVSRDKRILVQAIFPKYSLVHASDTDRNRIENHAHIPAIKAALPHIDLYNGIEDAKSYWLGDFDSMQVTVIDPRLGAVRTGQAVSHKALHENKRARVDGKDILLTKPIAGDACGNCKQGRIEVLPAIEVGHTFNLGTRYSKPLEATIVTASDSNQTTSVEMGCHGIGVSRLIAAISSIMADEKGLCWPAVVAPFSVAVVPLPGKERVADDLITDLRISLLKDGLDDKLDILVDDRQKGIGWRLHDADLIGYPIIIVVGRSYEQNGTVQVQCRRLGFKEEVPLGSISQIIGEQLRQL